MTMIVGVIAKSGILLASDTRCMVGNPKKFVGHHEQARKIAVSTESTPARIACAIACGSHFSFGESVITFALSWLSKHRFNRNTSLHVIHCEFEQRYKNINSQLPTGFSITSVFAKFEGGCPCISYGTLGKSIAVNAHSGVFCYPKIPDDAFEHSLPTREDAIAFVKEQITSKATPQSPIGSTVDICAYYRQ